MRNAREKGFVIIYAILGLFLLASIASTTAFVRYQAILAARERGQGHLAEAAAAAAKGHAANVLYQVAQELRPAAEAQLSGGATAATLGALAQETQRLADSKTCGVDFGGREVRVFFSPRACGEPAPDGFRAAQRSVPGGGLQAYGLDFLVLTRSQVGDARRTLTAPGTLYLYAGRATPAQFELFATTNYQADGTPNPFRAQGIWNGKVYVAGVPIFGVGAADAPGPAFLAPFFTARCLAVGVDNCPGGRGNVELVDVGSVPPAELFPTPFTPCYGPACPRFGGGVEWNAPPVSLYWEGTPTDNFDATGDARVELEARESPSMTVLRVTTTTGTRTVTVSPGSPRILRFAGGDVRVVGPVGSPAWHTRTSLTIVAERNLILEGNLFSQEPPCRSPAAFVNGVAQPPDCPGGGGNGMLGLVSETGDVVLSLNTPPEVYIHAAVLAPQGSFRPESLPTDRRLLTFMGSIAVKHFHSFFHGGRGWVTNLAYDPRLASISPPGWPLVPRTGGAVWGIVPVLSWGDLR